jgi:hypothetical protein
MSTPIIPEPEWGRPSPNISDDDVYDDDDLDDEDWEDD